MRPPTRLAKASPPAQQNRPGRLVGQQRKRAALVQCSNCDAIGTGIVAAGNVKSCNLPAIWDRGRLTHKGCGARLVAYDIAEAAK